MCHVSITIDHCWRFGRGNFSRVSSMAETIGTYCESFRRCLLLWYYWMVCCEAFLVLFIGYEVVSAWSAIEVVMAVLFLNWNSGILPQLNCQGLSSNVVQGRQWFGFECWKKPVPINWILDIDPAWSGQLRTIDNQEPSISVKLFLEAVFGLGQFDFLESGSLHNRSLLDFYLFFPFSSRKRDRHSKILTGYWIQ